MEFEKDLKNTNTQTDQQEESSVVCLIIKDLSDLYIRYDVYIIYTGCFFELSLWH